MNNKIFNIGEYGIGPYKAWSNRKATPAYRTWYAMLRRVYSEKSLKDHPSYRNCEVCKEWLNFQVFAQWFEENYIENFHLDKDLLIKDNKIYSPETCCFIPQEINSLLTKANSIRGKLPIGVSQFQDRYRASINIKGKQKILKQCRTIDEAFNIYKEAKENYIKIIADKYQDKIIKNAYDVLYTYKVERTD